MTAVPELQPRPDLVNPELEWLAGLSLEDFRQVFRGSPVKRTRYGGLRRNVVLAMANSGEARFLPLLEEMSRDQDPLVAGHARWAVESLQSQLRQQGNDGRMPDE